MEGAGLSLHGYKWIRISSYIKFHVLCMVICTMAADKHLMM
jgi:hypothetical protein